MFIDVDALSPGEDFAEVIAATLSRCPVVLVLIGPTWLTVTAPGGDRRLDEPTDLVGTEVATALDRDVEVIPVLLEGTSLPSAADLPERLRSLASTVPVEVSASHFDADIKALLARVVLVLGRPRRRVAEVVRAGLGGRLGLVAVSLAVLAALRYIAIKPDAGTVPTARAEASFPLPDGGTELVIDDGALWAWSRAAGELLVVETETDRVRSVATLPVSSPGPFAIAHGSLWVAADEGISRLEPTTGKEIAQIDVEARVTALAPSEDGLWVGLADDRARSEPDYGLLVHLDVDAGRLEEPLAVASPPTSLAELRGHRVGHSGTAQWFGSIPPPVRSSRPDRPCSWMTRSAPSIGARSS